MMQGKRPNILLITTDQHRYDAVGVNGNPHIRTPSLDRLAGEGVRFTAHSTSCALCTPARASILTGQYPQTHGAWDVGVTLPEDTPGLASWLGAAGYRCGLFGKAHFRPQMSGFPAGLDHSRQFYGFHEYALTEDNQVGEYLEWVSAHHPEHWQVVRNATHDGFPAPPDTNRGVVPDCYVSRIPEPVHQTSWITEKTMSFIEELSRDGTPFFAWCSYVDPHHPWNPIEEFAALHDPEKMPQPRRETGFLDARNETAEWYQRLRLLPDSEFRRICAWYYAMISHVDSAVGRIVDLLDKLGVLDDTIIVFTSDHGEYNGDHGLLRKGANLYDSILRVPLLVRLPERRNAGAVVDTLTQHEDIAPTLLELIGLDVPDSVGGVSFTSALQGAGEPQRRYAYYHHPSPEGTIGIRDTRWKLLYYPQDTGFVLFDTKDDPHEMRNAAGLLSCRKPLCTLKNELLRWHATTPWHRLPKTHAW